MQWLAAFFVVGAHRVHVFRWGIGVSTAKLGAVVAFALYPEGNCAAAQMQMQRQRQGQGQGAVGSPGH